MGRTKKSLGGRGFRIFILVFIASHVTPLTTQLKEFIPEAAAQNAEETADIFFNLNEHIIHPGDESKLKESVTLLKNDPGLVVVIEGYSDITGEDKYNLNLSRLRADSVRKYYIGRGIKPSKVKAVGKGKTDKYDSGTDEESLRRNRRVHIALESQQGKSPPSTPPPLSTPSPSPTAAVASPSHAPESRAKVPDDSAAERMAQDEQSQEPAAPALTELSAPPPDLKKAIDDSMRKLAPGRIIFDAPKDMNLGETYEVEVDLPYSFLKSLSAALSRMSAQGFDKVRLGQNVGLSLKGRGFDIRPVTETDGVEEVFPVEDTGMTKQVTENSMPSWKWKVAPLKSGYQSLLLSIEIMAEDADSNEMAEDYPLFQKIVDVKSNFLYTVTKSYSIMAVFIVIVVGAVGWLLIKKLRLG
ncbi:MAG: OmpA family protein [Thermodesulfobacteriota bacterium]